MLRFGVALALAAALSGCYGLKIEVPIEQPDAVQLTAPKTGRLVKKFEDSRIVWHILFGLIPIGNADISPQLRPQLEQGRRITNLKIHAITWFDLVGLITITQIKVEGDVVTAR